MDLKSIKPAPLPIFWIIGNDLNSNDFKIHSRENFEVLAFVYLPLPRFPLIANALNHSNGKASTVFHLSQNQNFVPIANSKMRIIRVKVTGGHQIQKSVDFHAAPCPQSV